MYSVIEIILLSVVAHVHGSDAQGSVTNSHALAEHVLEPRLKVWPTHPGDLHISVLAAKKKKPAMKAKGKGKAALKVAEAAATAAAAAVTAAEKAKPKTPMKSKTPQKMTSRLSAGGKGKGKVVPIAAPVSPKKTPAKTTKEKSQLPPSSPSSAGLISSAAAAVVGAVMTPLRKAAAMFTPSKSQGNPSVELLARSMRAVVLPIGLLVGSGFILAMLCFRRLAMKKGIADKEPLLASHR